MSLTKKANPPRQFDYTKQFLKDWKRLEHSGKFNLQRLKETMLLLIANNGPLPAEYLDHPLQGPWINHRDCHVGGDFLLIYRVTEEEVIFVRAGTHADLFE
ncbi:type II toxin-antitoxin system YafQ family toxin [Pararobbsia silviterrae]|uniref:Type II toxin-antitoxin system YafQ family toxin n=1 Tax=Pararobbsia silviterrae TaxID=1792498 RepID=A0A494Y9A3_9BURK|nr:type II toxin-antitoxin system YafQ family toxin [Pararobbsia silviterrae]RKP59282.1 type II toxin-antitoxin system YafQ family toxin [Pararobbsia silviterrae]